MASRMQKKPAVEVTQLLHADHRKVRDLFFNFKEAEDSAEKENLVKQILLELYIHSTVEEEIVYPTTSQEADDAEDIIKEAVIEHRVVKFLMSELSNMDADDEEFEAKVLVLAELVDHHIKEEEKEMFKQLRESGVDLADLAEQVTQRKEELKAQPMPVMQSELTIKTAPKTAKLATRKRKRSA